MAYRTLPLDSLLVNRANDRHGELENETAAIAWLFNTREQHMRNLTRDLVSEGEIYEPPLVSPDGQKFIVFDGNRRVTCLKLLADPRRAPTVELQNFFTEQRAKWKGVFPKAVQCQVETDRDRVDDILFRRHTGVQNGVGQSTWDDRMKDNFILRTGQSPGLNVADEIEKRLGLAALLPARKKIPRSTMNRLLSAEAFRNRVGITVLKGRFEYTHEEAAVLRALQRIADDLAHRRITLGDLWNVDDKRSYLDQLDREGVLPVAAQTLTKPKTPGAPPSPPPRPGPRPVPAPKPTVRSTLIPQTEYGIAWPGRLQRQKAIWEELQFHLVFPHHTNAIGVLFRVLLELAVENYITQVGLVSVHPNDKLAIRVVKAGENLKITGRINDKLNGEIKKLTQGDVILSMDTLNRYVHSISFAPSPEHLRTMWDALAELIVQCLSV